MSAVNSIIWALILFFLSFWIANFCAWWYIILLPLTVCIESLTKITDLLLKGVQFPRTCAAGMMSGSELKFS